MLSSSWFLMCRSTGILACVVFDSSEIDFQTELYLSGRIGAGHSSHRGGVHVGARTAEVRRVRKIKSLGPELQFGPLGDGKLLGERGGNVYAIIAPEYRGAGVAVSKVRGHRK